MSYMNLCVDLGREIDDPLVSPRLKFLKHLCNVTARAVGSGAIKFDAQTEPLSLKDLA